MGAHWIIVVARESGILSRIRHACETSRGSDATAPIRAPLLADLGGPGAAAPARPAAIPRAAGDPTGSGCRAAAPAIALRQNRAPQHRTVFPGTRRGGPRAAAR